MAYVIAEIGFNHGGDRSLAEKMIKAAATAGANAVKFQSFLASDICLKTSEHYSLIESAELSKDDHIRLKNVSDNCGVDFLSTPFSPKWVDFLDTLGVPAFKVASMDINFVPLLEKIAGKKKSVYLSTGISSLEEIRKSITVLKKGGTADITVLHCISNYPTEPEDAQLYRIKDLKAETGCKVGYSDHTLGVAIPFAAALLGAEVIEKHFTLDKNLPGPDHKISADSAEFRQLTEYIKTAEKAVTAIHGQNRRPDFQNKESFRRGIYAKDVIQQGQPITMEMLSFVRPEIVSMEQLENILNRKPSRDIKAGKPLNLSDLS